jgi:transcriptional regulator with XRE-family HTH domain
MSPEVQHMLSVLRSVIRGLGYNYQDVAKKLGLSSGYMSRLFSGKIDLKFQHIVDISRVLGFEPEEIFHLAYPRAKDAASPSALRYQMLTQPDSSLAGSSRVLASINSAAEEEEMERRVANALRKILTPPPPPSVPNKEEMEKLMERMLLKFIGGIQSKG